MDKEIFSINDIDDETFGYGKEHFLIMITNFE